jgi:F-box interacting protein
MARPPISAIPRVILQEILVKLPTTDIARCCCVSRLWRSAVRDPTFRHLHITASHVVSGAADVLLVLEKIEPKRWSKATVLNFTTKKTMCYVTNPLGYRLANVCNGFLCFASDDDDAPVVVCNPITGEKLDLSNVPACFVGEGDRRSLFALGFSPPTMEYKLFRFSYSTTTGSTDTIIDVCTLGDNHGWRRLPYPYPHRPVCDGSLPVLVGGKLYVVMYRSNQHRRPDKRPDRLLEIDVASETHCTCCLPEHARYEDPMNDVRVTAFEMREELCLAINSMDQYKPKLKFFVMASKEPAGSKIEGQRHCEWDLKYTFYLNCNLTNCSDLPRSAWLDDDGMMCYRVGDTLYKYDTRGYSAASPNASFAPWTQLKLDLPATDQSTSTQRSWNVCGGYRPTLLSPLTFALPHFQDDDEQIGHALLGVFGCCKSKPRGRSPSDDSSYQRPVKKIC